MQRPWAMPALDYSDARSGTWAVYAAHGRLVATSTLPAGAWIDAYFDGKLYGVAEGPSGEPQLVRLRRATN